MRTTGEVFQKNLLDLQGEKTMKETAAGAGIPYRTYQNMVKGKIPQSGTLDKLVKYYKIPASRLFEDSKMAPIVGAHQAVELVSKAFQNEAFKITVTDAIAALIKNQK